MRIVGIELSAYFTSGTEGSQLVKFALIPCDIQLEINQMAMGGYHTPFFIKGKIHTDKGDIEIKEVQSPIPTPSQKTLKIKQDL